MNRRDFGLAFLASGFSAKLCGEPVASYADEHPDMLLRHLVAELNDLSAKWDREREKIATPAQIEARNRYVREKMREMIHGLPDRNPLGPKIVKSFERPGYRVENVMFQSRPDFWVTGNLYVPLSGKGPFPGIISPCGHYADSRMNPEYQAAYINLVKNGFVVLAYDPIGQGERRQYWNPATNVTDVGGATTEHSMCGQLLLLMGEDLTHYRIWDGMRAVDYMLTRPEVDPEKIGCAGHSGGGTLTRFIAALDERVKVAVINEGGTTNRWPIDLLPESRIGPSDVEQNLFPGALLGVDHVDMQVAIAPRPLLALIEDYSPRFLRAADRIRKRYEQLGVGDRFATEPANDPHAWTVKLRLATTRWFSRWFYGKPGPDVEPEFDVEPEARLYCTPNGSIRYARQGATIYTLIAKKQAQLPPNPDEPAKIEDIRKLLDYRHHTGPLDVRHIVTTPRKGYSIEKLQFLSEPGIYIPAWTFVPDKPARKPAILYVHESGKEADGLEFGPMEELVRQGELVVSIDVRGIGATRPPHAPPGSRPGPFGFLFDVETAMAYLAWFANRSLLGMRVQDVVRAVDYTLSRKDADTGGVRVIGKGAGALWTLFAAALDPRIRSVVCERGLVSYQALTQTDRYLHGASGFIRDVLLRFDLPQVAALLADRELTVKSAADPMKQRLAPAQVEKVYIPTAAAFQKAGRAQYFRVLA
ncbi:MAG: acetylxylan esterase [Bryobacteraceae bacterium]